MSRGERTYVDPAERPRRVPHPETKPPGLGPYTRKFIAGVRVRHPRLPGLKLTRFSACCEIGRFRGGYTSGRGHDLEALSAAGRAHMIAASAPFASCGLTWTHISDAGVAPESDWRM